jgi:hypothetical protein
MGPARDPEGHSLGSLCSMMTGTGHVGNGLGFRCTPVGRYTLMPINGGGKPPYSVPAIDTFAATAAPAPKKLPVWGNPGIATARPTIRTVGVARAAAGARVSPNAAMTQALAAAHVSARTVT